MFGATTFEYQVEIMSEIKRLEEMIKVALPESTIINGEKNGMAERVQEKLDEIGCADMPISEIFSKEQWNMLIEYSKEDKIMALYYAIVIGFANGFEKGKYT